jgi:porphobilinogen synthase
MKIAVKERETGYQALQQNSGFPVQRMRRLRRNENLRRMVRETSLSIDDFVLPMFVVHGTGVRQEIGALPGNYHLSIDCLVDEAREVKKLGIPAVLLFGLPERKDEAASEAYASDGIVQRAVRALKKEVPGLLVITDVCMCEYTPHGHCGILNDGYLDNDRTLELIAMTTLSHAQAGSDIMAPAAMVDGQIAAMRRILDDNGLVDKILMGYSAKYASKLYDPFFKHGTKSAVAFGDKKTHQMDFGNSDEAMREIALDIEEGADIVMVKPAMFYLDIVYRAKEKYQMPLAVYNVSGEYTMIKAAAEMGKIDEKAVMMETMMAFKRAGADIIITYFAKELAKILQQKVC